MKECKWVRGDGLQDDDGGEEGIIYKAWTKEEGQRRNMVEWAL